MSSYSTCCHSELKVAEGIEHFHGSDDGYELKIPYVVCETCNKIQVTPYLSVNKQVEK